ncbi:MFS transporter, partial [Mesorhizobium sp. M1A.F.Ca.IN.022.07.1.1]
IQNYGYLAHAIAVTALAFLVIAFAVRYLIADDRPQAAGHQKFTLPRHTIVYLVGLMALLTMVSEGAVLDWAALYLQQELGADLAIAGLAYAAFSGVMALMRFLGDGVRNRFGAVATLRGSALVAAAGMLVAGLSPSPYLAIAAFAFCGFGIANMVPILFSAGGNQEGLSSGTGMSVVTTMGYSGILVAPSAIGFVAEHSSFGPIFVALSGLLVIVLLMANLAYRAEFAAEPAPAE